MHTLKHCQLYKKSYCFQRFFQSAKIPQNSGKCFALEKLKGPLLLSMLGGTFFTHIVLVLKCTVQNERRSTGPLKLKLGILPPGTAPGNFVPLFSLCTVSPDLESLDEYGFV